MSTDTVAILVTVAVAVGAAYAGLSRALSQLGERLARVEGIIEGWLNPPPPANREPPARAPDPVRG